MGKTKDAAPVAAQTDPLVIVVENDDFVRHIDPNETDRNLIVATFTAHQRVTCEHWQVMSVPVNTSVRIEVFKGKDSKVLGKARLVVQREPAPLLAVAHEDFEDLTILEPLLSERILDPDHLMEVIMDGIQLDVANRVFRAFESRREPNTWMFDFGSRAEVSSIRQALAHPELLRQISFRLKAVMGGTSKRANFDWETAVKKRSEEVQARIAMAIEDRLLLDKEAARRAVGKQTMRDLGLIEIKRVPSPGQPMVSVVYRLENGVLDDGQQAQALEAVAMLEGPAMSRTFVTDGVAEGMAVIVTVDY